VPRVHQLAILANVDNASAALEMHEVQSAAVALGIEAIKLEIRRAEDIAPAVETAKGRAEPSTFATIRWLPQIGRHRHTSPSKQGY